MGDFVRWLAELINLGDHYPDLVALLVGTLVGYTFTMTVETYFLPEANGTSKRSQQQFTALLCWLASGCASTILWGFFDPRDPLSMRLWVSFLVGILAFPGYPFLARLATALMPRIGSAWRKDGT